MTLRNTQIQLGAAACIGAAFLTAVAIPNWITSPSNVRNLVLSPTFWPYVLTGLTALVGLLLLVSGLRIDAAAAEPDDGSDEAPEMPGAWMRLGLLAAMMVVAMVALPRIGMVWTTMVLFVAAAFLYRTRHPYIAVACAVLVPLVLYAFFAHVAGVAIPQGDYVRLP